MLKKGKLEKLTKILLNHCHDMGVFKKNASKKKKIAVLDNLIAAVVTSEMKISELKNFINDVNNNEVFDIDFFNKGGNVYNYIKPCWLKFMKALWRQRSIGIGTPNSASGEGELMFIFSSPYITKPRKGDLFINGEIKELKGEQARVDANISGVIFREKTLEVCRKYHLTPNNSKAKSKIECVEIEKKMHLKHWKKELDKLSIDKQKQFILDWLLGISNNANQEIIEKIFVDNTFHHDIFVKEIVKLLYLESLKNNTFKSFILLGDGTNVKIINGNTKDFDDKIDDNSIKINEDYFRVNQHYNIGWYIE